jgi:hypothetical protein
VKRVSLILLLAAVVAAAQRPREHQHSELSSSTSAMSARSLDMGPHMKLTAVRQPSAEDQQRAAEITERARKAIEPYRDYRRALADGYHIFLPNVPQPMYHFTSYANAAEAAFGFHAERPTSLLYEKDGDGYRLIGVMYTAHRDASEEELNARIPLSVTQWHAHVNICMPPRERRTEMFRRNARFGLRGSIATESECREAGGRWVPQMFGWMVHAYPFESEPEKVWSLERQASGHRH